MRVVQVSAHFPPNFVSGGVLVPQRFARAAAAAGHESHVYAGYLDDARTPLSTFSETHEGDVNVRWIVTTPWTAWNDEKNWYNPAVEADFRAWLAEVRPDVVHLHSLQTLGGSLVRAAKESGAAVVVTMHDFWWVCARQFLATADLTPCSVVVSCGTCPCAAGHQSLLERDARLAKELAFADVVLAPSEITAKVLRANGVPADRLRVDENGLPATEAPVAHQPSDGPLRFMFAGGPDPMKGLPVLLRAAEQVADLDGWTLDLYGAGDFPTSVPPQVRVRGRYGREELGEVLAAHDVLVLPSVNRESHSILTREALLAGLAVVCTDTLGPEEAVLDGYNGMVVPAADADALAGALRRLVTDPVAARALMGKGSASPVRTLEDQTAGVLELYAELAAPPAPVPPEEDLTVTRRASEQLMRRVLFVVGIQGAPLRYRAHLPAEALRLHGVHADVRHYRDPALPELVEQVDAVVLYRVPATSQVLDLVAQVRRRERTVPVLFDVDDLIFDPELKDEVHGLSRLSPEEIELWWRGVARYRTTMEAADMFIGSTTELCRHTTAVTGLPSRRFANGVGTLLAQASDDALQRPRAEGPLRVGYFSGTNTHDADWAAVEPAVREVLEAHPDVELWLGGLVEPTSALDGLAHRVRRLPFVGWTELPGLLRDVDIALAPLTERSRFNEAKSAIKWLEAALVETPVVASPTEPFREAIDHGRTGFLAAGHEEWVAALTSLLDDVALRHRVGSQARRDALLRWSPHLQGRVYLENLLAAADHVRREGPRRPTDWEPVVDDEPLSAADAYVEPYALPAPAGRVPAALLSHPLARKAAAARRVYRAEGAREVGRRVVRTLRARVRR
ncbi:glycosyltransferase [Georgenia sp. 311]|uniref:Glycosyltransferase n=1 Tax=Georgenia wutianyii TaxID=2585135 RepID=A0ABX5VPK4_9MICO|nr:MULTISPECIES: glycosyltransferase [Georgenia]QDB78475.1 glycosyltransferase [Georgenia wutianyii]TNC16514.1 glycosyltransferase [Georgenia sp. 311]